MAAVILLIADGEQGVEIDPALLQSALRADPADVKVAVTLVEYGTMEQAADTFWTSPSTVRTQIKHIYAELGVDTRAGFVKLLLGLAMHRHEKRKTTPCDRRCYVYLSGLSTRTT